MSKRIAVWSIAAALLAGAVLPAAAADLYGYEEGGPPPAFHGRDEVFVERRGPGPVVFDERGPGHRFAGEWDAPPPPPPYGYGRPGPFFPRHARPGFVDAGYDDRAPGYGGFGAPEGGCTTEQARSVTPAGWQKTVTHRVCYQR